MDSFNSINTIGIKPHNIHNGMLISNFIYIIGTEEEFKLSAWQKKQETKGE